MVNNSLQEELNEVGNEYDVIFSYEIRRQHMYEKWRDFLRFYSFKVSDFILGPLKERNTRQKTKGQNAQKLDIVDEKGEMFSQKTEVLGWSDSMNGVIDATDELIKSRVQEIRKGLKENVSFRNIWKTMIEGIDKFPRINMPDMSLFVEKDEEHL